jgi:hypothetical protein
VCVCVHLHVMTVLLPSSFRGVVVVVVVRVITVVRVWFSYRFCCVVNPESYCELQEL